jgi:prepilin-type N-terminal cleavage/methylation domain-containing protein
MAGTSQTINGSIRASRQRRSRGFSMIELLITIAVVALLAALAIPHINVEGYKVNGAVRGITSTLSYSQRLAVTLQSDVWVAFDSANNRLRVHEDANNNGIIDNDERVTYTNLDDGVIFGIGATPAQAIGPLTFNFTRTQNGMPAVVFRRDGSASENGGFYLNTKRSIVMNDPNQTRAGEIVRSTGRVIWYSYSSGAWKRGD